MGLADRVAELAGEVPPVSADAAGAAARRLAVLAKPPGSLGALEALAARLAAIAGTCPPPVPSRPALVVAAGDHGVHAAGVTPWPQEVTATMVAALCDGRATANAFAATVGAAVGVLDVGVASDLPRHPRLRRARVREGTADLTRGPAMTVDDAARAVLAGAGMVEEQVAGGADLVVTGDMGIANTTPAACLVAALTGADPAAVTGAGSGADEATLARKRDAVRAALDRHRTDGGGGEPDGSPDAVAVLASLGGLEHAALVGVVLSAAAEGIPVVLDGVSTNAAALVAAALAPGVVGYLVAGHRSAEPGAAVALRALDLDPLLDLDLRLGEGTGALLAVPLVQAAARLLRDVATLDDLGVTPT